ncbi:U-scoloptoxin(01)-Cw1a-like [Penaeus monodon]|uniref:U-scoloptoxin(01)-Cw1a-like n=1 Tax=Penaeus monodon TaxID=6687 RepID=UPI0018A71758|nr:U-scoloptoxin(01)-Cw1a-like [Penaeus monodon]
MFSPPAPPAPGYSYGAPDLRADASTLDQQEQDPIAALAANIPGGGVPGEDYPILASVSDTGFSCEEQQFPGYYADTAPEAGCQVFHICQFDGRQDAFLCPNGTLFNQQYFVCDWWFNVDCAASEQFRSLNADIYGAPEAPLTVPSQLYNSPNRF